MQERARTEPYIIARYDASTGHYVVGASGGRRALSFAHPFAAARVGVIIAGELGSAGAGPHASNTEPILAAL